MSVRFRLCSVFLVAPYFAVAGQATWTVERAPILDLKGFGTDGNVLFADVVGATRLANGSLLIADRGNLNIRLVDGTGKLVHIVGRDGDGPGEFRNMMWAGGCGADSMLVWDEAHRKASIIGASGAVARQFSIPTGDTARAPFQFSCSRDRAVAYLGDPRPASATPTRRSPTIIPGIASLYRVSTSGSVLQRLGELPYGEMVATTSRLGGLGAAPLPLTPSSSFAVVGKSVAIAYADSAAAIVVAIDGKKRRISIPITRRAPTRADFDGGVEAIVDRIPLQARWGMKEQLTSLPMPALLPPISALFGDSEGLLWVQTSPPGAKVTEMLVMRLDGSTVARTQIPTPLTVYEIGRDYVLGSYTDAGDETHIAIYRFSRR